LYRKVSSLGRYPIQIAHRIVLAEQAQKIESKSNKEWSRYSHTPSADELVEGELQRGSCVRQCRLYTPNQYTLEYRGQSEPIAYHVSAIWAKVT
jgi:hypothetical protein